MSQIMCNCDSDVLYLVVPSLNLMGKMQHPTHHVYQSNVFSSGQFLQQAGQLSSHVSYSVAETVMVNVLYWKT